MFRGTFTELGSYFNYRYIKLKTNVHQSNASPTATSNSTINYSYISCDV